MTVPPPQFTPHHHVWLLLVALACLSSLTCLTVFFPSHHLHPRATLLHPLFLCSSLVLPRHLCPPVTLCSRLRTALPSLKSTKSRGSKHKSRRKPKKQKRPSSVCNPNTWSQSGSRPLRLIILFFWLFFLNYTPKCACACWILTVAVCHFC